MLLVWQIKIWHEDATLVCHFKSKANKRESIKSRNGLRLLTFSIPYLCVNLVIQSVQDYLSSATSKIILIKSKIILFFYLVFLFQHYTQHGVFRTHLDPLLFPLFFMFL